jgi:hypothetical protein
MEFLLLYMTLAFFGVFGAGAVVYTLAGEKKQARRASAWAVWASRRGHSYSDGDGRVVILRIEGTHRGASFWLTVQRSVQNGELSTRLGGAARPGAASVLVVVTRGSPPPLFVEAAPAATGDAHFDSLFAVRASRAADAAGVLGDEMRKLLQRFPPPLLGEGLRFAVEGEDAMVEWTGDAIEETKLAAAHAVLAEARHAP